MAADISTLMILEQSRKRQRLSHVPKLLRNEKVEVRSVEEGFRGSWHRGVVIECRTQIRVVKYDHLLCDDGPDPLVEFIPVLFAVDGRIPAGWRPSDFPNYRGKIRPVPPWLFHDEIFLHYGQCVDVFHADAWWEGVVFDHDVGSEECLVFFPDIGDELRARFNNLRITQDWDAASDEWKVRGDWIFLQVIEELKVEWPLLVSVKQIWYEVRMTKCFVNEMKEWTCPVKESWKEPVKEVIVDNLKLAMKEFFHRLQREGHPSMDIKKCLVDSMINLEPSFFKSLVVEEEFHDTDKVLAIKSDYENLSFRSEDLSSKRTKTVDYSNVWSNVVPQAECCPDAIFKYYKYFKSGKRPPFAITLKVQQHLSYLGWNIESKRHSIASKGKTFHRYRYTDPNGKQYYSLNVLCAELNEGSSESTSFGSFNVDGNLETQASSISTKEEPQTLELTVIESEYCPQAVVDYCSLTSETKLDMQKRRDDTLKKLQTSAKKHLFAVGWSNFYVERISSGRKVLVYSSPSGRKFYGLHEACSHYVTEYLCFELDNTFNTDVGKLVETSRDEAYGDLIKKTIPSVNRVVTKNKALTNTHVLRSSKRARKYVSSMYQTPRTVLSWLIDNNVVLPRAKVQYRCKKDGHAMREGRVTRDGIKCSCCQHTFSLSKFQSHAKSTYGRPSASIFLEDGRSLLDCQLELKHDQSARLSRIKPRHIKGNRREIENDNDYICSVCQYGGELILCDQCPSSFHTSCVGLKEVPDGEWFCPSCCCRVCNQNRFGENYEQITDSNILNCEQCDKRYHIGCLKGRGLSKPEGCLETNWFCSLRCEEIYSGLHRLLGKSIPVGRDNLTWTLRKNMFGCSNYNASDTEELTENYSKLNVAASVMHECFEPVKEPRTGRDIVEDVIFCRCSELRRLNFKGFYTILLEKDDELISTAAVRVYGEKVAEIPLVGTRFQYRRRGMCHLLMDKLEKKLKELGVERLVLPAVSSVLHAWTRSFGFSVMTEFEKSKLLGFTFLDFQGTTMCHKLLAMDPPSTEPSLSRGLSCSTTIDLDRISAVSEVSQAERIEESGIIELSSSELNGDTTHREILMNLPTHIVSRSETSLQHSTEASNPNPKEGNNDINTGILKCYQRRKFR